MARSPTAAPSAVYRCTPQAKTVRSLCLGTGPDKVPAAALISSIRLQIPRPEIVLEHGHEWSARPARLDQRERLFQGHPTMGAQEGDGKGRRPVQSTVAMQINPTMRIDQLMQVGDGDCEPVRHRIGAAILNRCAPKTDTMRIILGPELLEVEAVVAQVVIVLEVMNRGDVVGVFEPFDIAAVGIFADQQL